MIRISISGLRGRLLLLVLLAILPVLGVILFTVMQERQIAIAKVRENNLRIARLAALNAEKWIEGAHQLLQTLAETPEVRDLDSEACSRIFASLCKQHPHYKNIGLTDSAGQLLASALPFENSVDLSDRQWFRRARETRSFVVGNYQVGRVTGLGTINLAHPVLDEEGKWKGVAFIAFGLDALAELVRETELPVDACFLVLDREGTLLTRVPGRAKSDGPFNNQTPLATSVITQKEGIVEAQGFDRVKRIYAFTPVNSKEDLGFYVVYGVSRTIAFTEARQVMIRGLGLLAVIALGVLLLALFYCDRFLLRWVDSLVAATKRLASGDLNARAEVPDGQGELTELANAFNETTTALARREEERRNALAAVRENEERFRTLSSSSPLGIFLTDPEGRCLYVNPRYRQILGIGLMESLGDGWANSVHPADRESVMKDWHTCVAQGREYSREFRVRIGSGTTRWVHSRCALILTDEGKPNGYVGTLEDITERRQAEDMVRESEERYRSLVEAAQDVIFTLSPDGVFTSLNSAFESMTGWPRDQWIGKTFVPLIHPEDLGRAMEMLQRVLHGENAPVFELRVFKSDGGHLIGQITATPQVKDGAVIGVLGIARDITEKRRLEEQFLQAQKVEAIGRLAGGVAHDFNNILTAIIGYNDLILRHLRTDDPLHAHAEQIGKAADRAKSLTRRLLAFSRRQTIQPKVIDLNVIVEDMQKLIQRLIGETVQFVSELSAAPTPIKADVGQIEQLIMNLAVNAGDAMPKGGTLTIRTGQVTLDAQGEREVGGLEPGDYALLEVSDTGIGMTDEVKAHLFEPFFTTKPQGKGTGLGLATVYGVVKQNQGHITVKSEVGKGTTFTILLPLTREEGDLKRARQVESEELPRGRERVLLVEDEPAVRELAVLMLRDLGYDVLDASNGQQAWHKVRARPQTPVDLVVTDVVMPHMGGVELVERLRKLHPRVKILFTSGYTQDAIGFDGILAEDVALLEKPFTSSTLARKIREVLDNRCRAA